MTDRDQVWALDTIAAVSNTKADWDLHQENMAVRRRECDREYRMIQSDVWGGYSE